MELLLKKLFDPPLSLREIIMLPLVFFGIFISVYLILQDIKIRGYCPSLGITPVCYLNANAFILILLSIFFVKKSLKTLFFFAGSALGISIAVYFSASHLLYINHCAFLCSYPDCFINFFLFFVIFVVRTVEI
jgi:hypothetical protein